MGKYDNISGNRYNQLVAIRVSHRDSGGREKWEFKCDCGKTHISYPSHVVLGKTKSCGCYNKKRAYEDNFKHGLVKHKLYSIRGSIISRCFNETDPAYKYYGGRGITICNEWREDFKKFYDYCISAGWREGLEIDRIDNKGNYEPGNIGFVTKLKNRMNRSDTKIWYVFGEAFETAIDAAKKYKVSDGTIRLWCGSCKGRKNKEGCWYEYKYK